MGRYLKILIPALALLALGLLSVYCAPEPTPSPTPTPLVTGVPLGADTVQGIVVDDQGPVAGATVRVRATANKTLTAGDGSFTLAGLTAGVPVSVTAWSEGYFVGWTSAAPGPEPITITIKPHYTTDNPDYDWFSTEGAEGSQSCARCMPAYPEWQADAHSQSATNPLFQTLLNGADMHGNPGAGFGLLTDRGRADFVNPNSNCAPCHVPVATDLSAVSGIAAEGVFCEFCHKVGDVTLDPTTGLPYPDMPGVLSMRLYRPEEGQQLFFGNFDDVTRRVSYLPLEEESAFCAPCHFGAFWDTVAYNSFGEWLESSYSDPETGQTCQDCHMPLTGYDYFVFPKEGGLRRDPNRIFSHLMPGARDEEFLQSTVTMVVTATQGTDGLLVEVAITNSGAGHHVPTDSPLRHLLLLVQARDGQGRPLDYVGRQVVPDWGGVGDPAQGNYAGQPGKGFAKIQQDADGNAPAPQWRSTEIIYDNRIPALVTDTSYYAFSAPVSDQVEVKVTLIFRRAFKAWADQKDWDVPDIVMARDERQAVVVDRPVLADLEPRYDTRLFAPSPATTASGYRLHPDDFSPSETCAECHAGQHAAWQASAHGRAGDNPAYQGWLLAAVQSTENRMARFCAACHTPAGMLVGQVRVERNWRGFFLRPFGEVAREGVSCVFCHTVATTTGLGNGAYVSDPLAPLPAGQDAVPHKGAYRRDWYGSAEFCATCHQAQHPDNGLPLMTTYGEWQSSPYNTGDPATTRTCQDCHGAGHGGVSQEQLASAAQVRVVEPATVQPGQVNLRVEVRNVGAGHALPTGATELCRMWLEVTVTDTSGRELFRSGNVDQYGDPDENTVTYGTVWEDSSGVLTIRMWEAAAVVSDHRIPPQGSVTETYSFSVHQDVQGPLQAQAVLKYRAISGYFAGIMGIMADSQRIESPVVEMARNEVVINIEP